MKKLLLGFLALLFMLGCGGSFRNPAISYSVSMGADYKEAIHMVDRKIISIDLDTTQGGYAVFKIRMEDQIQFGQKIVTVPWDVSISFQEGKNFRILKYGGQPAISWDQGHFE